MTSGRTPTIPALLQTYVGKALPCPGPGDQCEGIPHLISPLSLGTSVLESERDTGRVCEILLDTCRTYTVLSSGDSAVNRTKSLPSWGLKSNWGRQQLTNRQIPAGSVSDSDRYHGGVPTWRDGVLRFYERWSRGAI